MSTDDASSNVIETSSNQRVAAFVLAHPPTTEEHARHLDHILPADLWCGECADWHDALDDHSEVSGVIEPPSNEVLRRRCRDEGHPVPAGQDACVCLAPSKEV